MNTTASSARSRSASVEHDHRVLAAQLEMHALQRRGTLHHDRGCRSRLSPTKPDRLDVRMLGQRLAGVLAEAVHGVEHAGWQTGLDARSRPAARAVSGLHSAGLCTTVHPAASAGAIFHVDSMNGVFQGVITPTGPDRLAACV